MFHIRDDHGEDWFTTFALDPEKQNYLKVITDHFKCNRLGYIKVPTGWGKTFLAKHLMKQYYEQGKVVLFLVSRNNQLLNQTFYIDQQRNTPLFPNNLILSSEHSKIGVAEFLHCLKTRIGSGNGGTVVFASLQTLLSEGNKEIENFLCRTANLVIIDEIHNFIDDKGNDFINQIGEHAHVLGMTATPSQGIVGHVKFVEDIKDDMREIFSKTLPQCIIDGQLSELSYTIIRSNQSILDIFDFQKGPKELRNDELYLDCGEVVP